MASDGLQTLLDRLAISDVVTSYAQMADRRDGEGVGRLFTDDGVLALYTDPATGALTEEHRGREAIAAQIDGLARFTATSHSLGNHLATVDGDGARAQTRCTAFHVSEHEGTQRAFIWHLHYDDALVRRGGIWLLRRRELRVDFAERRPLVVRSGPGRQPAGA